jgi:ribosome-associated protein
LATKKRGAGEGKRADAAKKAQPAAARATTKRASANGARPRIRASHEGPSRSSEEAPKRARRPSSAAGSRAPSTAAIPLRKAPLTGPRRAGGSRRSVPPPPEPSGAARDLAVAIAAAGIDKKALGIEILDVTGKVDYADFLVIMTGRSDRHVHAIATGLEEALRHKKLAPLSIEGLAQATWVLIDFGDVVVHVFQEDARRLYDIEGLWIDASRVPVPAEGPAPSPDQP